MSNFLKPFLVLVISCLIFFGVAYLIDEDILDFVQTHFYNPSIVKSYIDENKKDMNLAMDLIQELQDKFENTLSEPAVRSSFLYNQSAEDIFQRSRIYGILMESTTGLQSVQFIDRNGIRIHFSTSLRDIISQDAASVSYRNYTEDTLAMPYETISVPENGNPKFTMDENSDRIIFSFPFNDAMDVYHGTALFSVSIGALAEKLVAEGRLKVNENVSVIGQPPGVIIGIPAAFKSEINKKVSEVWSNAPADRITIDSESSGRKFSLISTRENNLLLGRLINDDQFNISEYMKIILYISIFSALYLALYFIINFKPSPVTVVRNRIRRLRDTLFEQLYQDKSTQEKIRWLLELEQRRDEVKHELKYKLKISRKTEKNLDAIIDKSWDEIIAVVRANSGHAALALKIADLDAKEIVKKAKHAEVLEEVEEAEALEEVESLEEVEEAEALEEVESLEEVEEAEALEEVEEAEALEEVEEAEALEEVEEAETLEEVESLEEVEEAEALEEVEEAEALEEVESLEEVEEAETLEEVESLEEVEEAETLEEAEITAEKTEVFEVPEDLISFEEEKILVKPAITEHKEERSVVIQKIEEALEIPDVVIEAEEFLTLVEGEPDSTEETETFNEVEISEDAKEAKTLDVASDEFDELAEFVEEVVLSPEFKGVNAYEEKIDVLDEAEETEEMEEIVSFKEEPQKQDSVYDIENFIEILDNFDEELGLIASGTSFEEKTTEEEIITEEIIEEIPQTEEDTAPAKSLLQLASEVEPEDTVPTKSLLQLASEVEPEDTAPTKSLLQLASEVEPEDTAPTKSLLQLASEIETEDTAPTKSLLQLASEVEPEDTAPTKSLLHQASEYAEKTSAQEVYPTLGLLARAIREIHLADTDASYKAKTSNKGLLELASRIEFIDTEGDLFYKNKTEDTEDTAERDDDIEMDIFFPLDDMFSSLSNMKTNEDSD